MNEMPAKTVYAELWYSEDLIDVGITINNSVAKPLTSQEIIDAISDILVEQYPNLGLSKTNRDKAH